MKLYSWNTQKISVNDNGKIKTIAPFFLISDDKAHLFENSNYTDLGNIFNVEELKSISSNIEMVTGDIKDIVSEKTEQLQNAENLLNNASNMVETLKKEIKEIQNLKTEYLEIIHKAREYYNTVKNGTEENMAKLTSFQKNTDEKIKEAEFAFNKANTNISDLMEQAENKTAAKYLALNLKMDSIYNKYINTVINKTDECKKYAEISKKWACNPLNLPVENGKYSALHYSLTYKNKVEAVNE